MAGAEYWKKRLLRHLLLMVCASLMVMVVYALTPSPDVRHRASMALAYAALVYLLISLWLGPWNLLRGKLNPVSFDLRRDFGIWAGILALLHTGVGLTVHLRGRMWMYFFKNLHPLQIQKNLFGFGNYTGLFAAFLFVFLLAISNDLSLRSLGTRRWKRWQQWTYMAALLTLLHGIAYEVTEKRKLPWVVAGVLGVGAITAIQVAGVRRKMRARMSEFRRS
jgi:methionine sulfoxide reductase heme-binding subunit